MSPRRARLAALILPLAVTAPLLLTACEKADPSPAPSASAPAAVGVEGARANLRTTNVSFELTLNDITGQTPRLTASGAESPGLVLLWKQAHEGAETQVHVNGPDIWTTTAPGTWTHFADRAEGMRTLSQYSPTELAGWLIDAALAGGGAFQPTGAANTHRAVLKWTAAYPDTGGVLARMTKGVNVSADRPVKTSDVVVTITDGHVSELLVVSGEATVLKLTLAPASAVPEAKPTGTVTEAEQNPVAFP